MLSDKTTYWQITSVRQHPNSKSCQSTRIASLLGFRVPLLARVQQWTPGTRFTLLGKPAVALNSKVEQHWSWLRKGHFSRYDGGKSLSLLGFSVRYGPIGAV